MNDEIILLRDLAARLRSSGTPRPVTDLVLAAYQADESLNAVLAGGEFTAPDHPKPEGPGVRANVWLEAVRVEGFRGVGPQATLTLRPHAGLTLVIGRNGSGRSRLAEAAEPAVKLRLDGQAPQWLSLAGPDRPFLPARDLERVITAKPAELNDALAPILGLVPLSTADTRLRRRIKEHDDRVEALRESFTLLRAELGEVDDDRARQALAALGKQSARADLAALIPLVDGTAEAADHPAASAARHLLDGELPDPDGALTALHEAETAVARLAGGDSAAAVQTAGLLRQALDLHDAEGDQQCPVCRAGWLDAGWHEDAEAEVARLEAVEKQARTAHNRVSVAHGEAVQFLQAVRHELGQAATALETTMPGPAARLREALAAMPVLSGRPGATGEAEAARVAWLPVVVAYADLVEAATRWLVHRQNAWREPEASLRRWVDAATVVRADADTPARLVAARAALGTATNAIRAQRLAAFVGQSARIWQRLRRESDVEPHRMRVADTTTQRRVRFPVSVDGTRADAPAVMSQGELHALALAVFLPRAGAQAGPFRFVVVDDPVQSMDPAEVDGLAEVLGEVAETRQVVVLTHDDRLPEAVRRLGLEATVWEVPDRRPAGVTRSGTDRSSAAAP